jgi:glycosyltransferase involved in cell wall biosynthesis
MNRNLAIVPAHNEVEAIGSTIAAIHQWAPDFDVLVIDDGSTDATGERASVAGAAVLRLPFNLGIGGAMQSGYIYALERGYDVAVQVDGDGQHDPRHMHELLDRLQGDPTLNMVTGSPEQRELAAGADVQPGVHDADRDAHQRQHRDVTTGFRCPRWRSSSVAVASPTTMPAALPPTRHAPPRMTLPPVPAEVRVSLSAARPRPTSLGM